MRLRVLSPLYVVLSLSDISAGAMLLIIPWRGWAPPHLTRRCSTGASRRFSVLANSAAGRSTERGRLSCSPLPGRCTSAPAAIERAGGHPVYLTRCRYARARQSGGNEGDRASRPARAGGVVLRRWPAGVFDLAKLLVAIQGDDGARAVTDAADGGIADRGGGRGTYPGHRLRRRPNSAAVPSRCT